MGYTIINRAPITVNGPYGEETVDMPPGGLYATEHIEIHEDPTGTATSEEIFAAFPTLRGWKEKYIRGIGAAKLEEIANPYSPQERTTWFLQREEAVAWVADHAVPTPFCDSIAAARGIPRQYFLPKVLENNNLFTQASAQILGQQQALIDRVWMEQDFSVFINIGWP